MAIPQRDVNEVARLIGGQALGGGDNIRLRQGIITDIGMGNVSVLFASEAVSEEELFPIGGIPFLQSYRPIIGQTVWVWKNGPDMVVIGPVQARAANESEAWHYVGQEEYDEPAFLNGWHNYGSVFENAAFYMDPDGFVHLKGLVQYTVNNAKGIPIFTMPDAYRPEYRVRAPCLVSASAFGAGAYMVEIFPNGTVQFVDAPNGTAIGQYASLSGVSYQAKGAVEYDRIHEWTPFGRTWHAWTWDADIENHTPPGLWDRWDGLMRTRGRYHNGTSGAIVTLPERACKTRWDKLFCSVGFDPSFNAVQIRVDVRPQERLAVRVGSTIDQELSLESFQWLADIPESYWTELDLQNSWVNYSSSGDPYGKWGPAAYFKDGYGHVHLRGLIADGATPQDTVLAWLPEDCRPEMREVFLSMAGGELATRIDVRPDGAILQAEASLLSNDYLSLDQVHFRANPNYTL